MTLEKGQMVPSSRANTRLRSRAQLQCGAALLASGSSTPCWRGAQFLADACAGDVALHQEVASLLVSYEDAGSFIGP